MKKVILSGVAMLALATATLFTTSSCKKDEPAPATVAGVAFDTEKTGTVYANNTDETAGQTIGSFYSLELGSSQATCAARSTSTGGSFQLMNPTGTTYELTNIATFGSATAATCGITSGTALTNGATFGTTTLAYASITAEDVDKATIDASKIDITSATTILIKNKAGKKGVMSISLSDDAGNSSGANKKKKLTFALKMLK